MSGCPTTLGSSNASVRCLAAEPGLDERRMFGGVAFLVDGSMALAASGQGGLMVRVPPQGTADVLALEHTAPMVMSGREVRGWVRVTPAGYADDGSLGAWVRRGVDHARTLAPRA
ncbi:MAG: TfoX/Sxy family protein [Aeromicrobium erythreum]